MQLGQSPAALKKLNRVKYKIIALTIILEGFGQDCI